jgi:hypothetical protein
MQKLLIILGLVFLALGLCWPLLRKIGLGRMPGDIVLQGDNFKFYFPVATCIVISLVLTAVMWLLNR